MGFPGTRQLTSITQVPILGTIYASRYLLKAHPSLLQGIPCQSWKSKRTPCAWSRFLMVVQQIHIASASPYVEPSFDSGFMNHKADFAPIRWSYKKTREVARRMDGGFVDFFCTISFDGELYSLPWRAYFAPPSLPSRFPRGSQGH